MHRTSRFLVLTALVAMLAAACGEAPDTATTPSPGDGAASPTGDPTDPQTEVLACQVTDTGGVDDRSFNQTAYAGVQRAEDELGIEGRVLESSSASDYQPNIDAFIDQGCDLIVTVGFLLGDATQQAAEANPEQNFAIVDFAYEQEYDNVLALTFATDQAAFLAGYLAAGMTETGTVGTYGGLNIPTVTIFMDGFAAGVAYYNQEKGTDVEVLGWDPANPDSGLFTGDFENQDNGRRTTETLLQNGADIILPVAGPVGLGTAAAVQETGGGAKVIWVDTDGCVSAEQYCDLFLTSVLKNMDVAVFDAIEAEVNGEFEGGLYTGTLENGGVDIAPYHGYDDQVPQELKDEIEDLRQAIIDGSVEVSPG